MCRTVLPALSLAMFFVSVPCVISGDEDNIARFAEGTSNQTDRQKFLVTAEVLNKELFKTKDVWLGVIPVEAPASIWMQGTKLFKSLASERVVYLGPDRALDAPEKFQICICICNKGAIRRDGEIRLSDADKYGLEIVASCTVERTK